MKKSKIIIIFIVTFLVLAVSFVFPSIFFKWQDSKLYNAADLADVNELSLSLSSEMSLLEKAELVCNYDSSVELDTGRFMNSEQAIASADAEIESLAKSLYIDISEVKRNVVSCYPTLNSGSNHEKNNSVILWHITYDLDTASLYLGTDDETGKILSFSFYDHSFFDTESSEPFTVSEKEAMGLYGDPEADASFEESLVALTVWFSEYLNFEYIDIYPGENNNIFIATEPVPHMGSQFHIAASCFYNYITFNTP